MTNSLFTLQSTPARVNPGRCLLIFSKRRSNAGPNAGGGGERIRTDDLLLAKQALSQLSYTPLPEIRDQNTEIRKLISDLWLPISGTGGPGRI